ncbi:O-antigen ligase family protein [bacterium]|nr:O-antigen ligase family protein [bacterium]
MYFFIETFVAPTDYLTRNQLLAAWKDRFLLGPILYFVIVKAMQQRKDIYTLLMVMCLANIYMATFFYRWVRWLNLDSFADKIKKVNGTFGDIGGCNEWAAFFSTYTFVLFATVKTITKKYIKWFVLALGIANVFVLLFTFSRGSYLAFVIGLVYYFLKSKKFVYLLIFAMLPVFYTTVLPTAVVQRIEMSFQGSLNEENSMDQDVDSRLMMWEQSLDMISEAPLFGTGVLSFHSAHWNNPHNQHLNILVQGGGIGYILFLWLFVASFREAKYLFRIGADPFSRAFGLGMTVAILSLFIANIFGDRWSYYVLTGYLWVLNGVVYFLIDWSRKVVVDKEKNANLELQQE